MLISMLFPRLPFTAQRFCMHRGLCVKPLARDEILRHLSAKLGSALPTELLQQV